MAPRKPIQALRQVLHSIHKVGYRIRSVSPDKESMNKASFIRILTNLKKIEDRRDFMQDEIGMDMTMYEETFFQVIEDLFKITFGKEQCALIQMYLYQLVPDKEWDGTITIEQDKKELQVNFRTPEDVWKVLKEISS